MQKVGARPAEELRHSLKAQVFQHSVVIPWAWGAYALLGGRGHWVLGRFCRKKPRSAGSEVGFIFLFNVPV